MPVYSVAKLSSAPHSPMSISRLFRGHEPSQGHQMLSPTAGRRHRPPRCLIRHRHAPRERISNVRECVLDEGSEPSKLRRGSESALWDKLPWKLRRQSFVVRGGGGSSGLCHAHILKSLSSRSYYSNDLRSTIFGTMLYYLGVLKNNASFIIIQGC